MSGFVDWANDFGLYNSGLYDNTPGAGEGGGDSRRGDLLRKLAAPVFGLLSTSLAKSGNLYSPIYNIY